MSEEAIWASCLTHHRAQLEAPGKPKSVQAKASFRKLSILSVKTSDCGKSFHSPHKQLVINAKCWNFTFFMWTSTVSPFKCWSCLLTGVCGWITSSPILQGQSPLNLSLKERFTAAEIKFCTKSCHAFQHSGAVSANNLTDVVSRGNSIFLLDILLLWQTC